jgi:tripartite motif-containing protein 71
MTSKSWRWRNHTTMRKITAYYRCLWLRRVLILGAFIAGWMVPSAVFGGASGPSKNETGDTRKELWAECTFLGSYGQKGFNPQDLYNPTAAAIGPGRALYVVDTFNHQVKKYRLVLELEAVIGRHGKEEGQFIKPSAVAVDDNGDVYVADMMNNRIQVFDHTGRFIRAWGAYGREPGQLANPLAIELDSEENVYVADMNSRISVFDRSGKLRHIWNAEGAVPPGLSYPAALAFDRETGLLYAADANNNRVLVIDRGEVIDSFREIKGLAGGLSAPSGLAIEGARLIVADTGHNRVMFLDKLNGTLLAVCGKQGTGPGQFSEPRGIAVMGTPLLFIVDRYNNRVQMLGGRGDSK